MDIDEQIDKLIKQATYGYYITMIITICVIGAMALLALEINWLIGYILLLLVIHIAWLLIIIKRNHNGEDVFISLYYIFMFIYMFPGALILWQIEVGSILLLYVLFPLIVFFRFNNLKDTVCASMVSMLFIIAIITLSSEINFSLTAITKQSIFYLNIAIVIAATAFIIVFSYYSHGVLKLKNAKKRLLLKEQEAENAKLKKLYMHVTIYFETKQAYRQPNFRLSMLAAALNTNTKYLSKAINTYYGGSFESLLNEYRLNFVKKMLDNSLTDKYTMEYIYTSAGYSSRTAFYENFRKTFKMSPLDYQKLQKSKSFDVRTVFFHESV